MAYKWIEITQDFDRSLPFSKVRWDLSKDAAWATVGGNSVNGYFSEVPNINADGLRWSNITGSSFGYAGQYRFTLREPQGITNGYVFSCKAEGFTDHSIPQYATLIEGEIYEYTYPLDLYWAGIGVPTNPLSAPEGTGIFVYVDTGSISVDTEEIAADSGASSYTISVSAETGITWTASTNDNWISLAPTTGEGNGSITVSVAEAGYTARTGSITITSSEGDSITVSVNQAKKALILTRKDMYQGENLINKMYRNGEVIYQRIYVPGPQPEPVYSAMPLTFEIISGGTIEWRASSDNIGSLTISYSLNEGEWVNISSNSGVSAPSITVNEGDIISFKGDNTQYGTSLDDYTTFCGSTAYFNAYGNIMSLYDSDDFESLTAITETYSLLGLFKKTNIVSGEHLIMPATAIRGYSYGYMFQDCTNLIVAPELPGIDIGTGCYSYMFQGCTSLTTAPDLPAATLKTFTYYAMFSGCTNLNYIKCLATTLGSNSTTNFTLGVAASGTFVKDATMSSWTTGVNGIPVGWTVIDAE